jgi:hypothetical protein
MSKEQRKMDLQTPVTIMLGKDLESVAEKIRPLPESIVPSDRFRVQMRRRLLKLNAKAASAKRAA